MKHTALVWTCGMGMAFTTASTIGLGAAVIETDSRMEINWTTLRLRYYGEAAADSGSGELKAVEKRAWRDGLNYAGDAVRNLNITVNEPYAASPEKLSEDARQAAHQVSVGTYSYNTTYFADGTVRVYLESPLAKALESSAMHFRQKESPEPAMTQYSGIVLQADHAIKPRATYQITDETGAVVFDIKDMAQASYRKNLMGRWLRKPGPGELADTVGKNPLLIPVVAGDGKFLVKRDLWDKATEGQKSLLVNGTIAIALP